MSDQESAMQVSPVVTPPKAEPPVAISDVDFNELLELEKARASTEEQLNKLSGMLYRMEQDQKAYFEHERVLYGKTDALRKDLVRRYKIDETKKWQIDANTRQIVYLP